MKLFRVMLTLLLLLTLNVRAGAKELPVMGIVDFTSRVTITNLSNEQILTFQTATDVIMDEIIDCVELRDLTGETSQAILDEMLIMSQSRKLTPELQEIAAIEDCDYLLVGYLMNLSRTTGDRIIGKSDGIRANLSVRIFDMKTGKQVAVYTGKGIAKSRVNRIGRIFRSGQLEFSEDCLNQALEIAAKEIATKIKRSI